MESSIDELKSPPKKLIAFFRSSRDGWKAKYKKKNQQAILLANQVRAVEKSRQFWRDKAEQAKRELAELKAQASGSN